MFWTCRVFIVRKTPWLSSDNCLGIAKWLFIKFFPICLHVFLWINIFKNWITYLHFFLGYIFVLHMWKRFWIVVRTMRSAINNVMLIEKWNCGVEVCPKYLMGEIFFGKYKIHNPIFCSKFGLKHVIKLIIIKYVHSNLLIFSFKIKI